MRSSVTVDGAFGSGTSVARGVMGVLVFWGICTVESEDFRVVEWMVGSGSAVTNAMVGRRRC